PVDRQRKRFAHLQCLGLVGLCPRYLGIVALTVWQVLALETSNHLHEILHADDLEARGFHLGERIGADRREIDFARLQQRNSCGLFWDATDDDGLRAWRTLPPLLVRLELHVLAELVLDEFVRPRSHWLATRLLPANLVEILLADDGEERRDF